MKVKFNDVFTDDTKNVEKIPTNEYAQNGDIAVVDQGKRKVIGFTNNKNLKVCNEERIIFGDHTRIFKYINIPFITGADGTKVLKIKDTAKFDYKYMYYYLQNSYIPNTGYNRHFKWVKELGFEIPNIKKQKELVNILDKVQKLIDIKEEQKCLFEDFIKSKFVEMFGDPVYNNMKWNKLKMIELGILERGTSKHRPRNAPELLGGIYPLIQTGDVSNSGLYIRNYKMTYSEAGLKQSKMWNKNTLCITIAANIARTSILGFDACFPDSVVAFITNGKVNNIFMHYWFEFLQNIIESKAPQVAQKNINLKILEEMDVIVPPIELQNKFAKFANQIDKLKSIYEKSLETAQELMNKLMDEYFNN